MKNPIMLLRPCIIATLCLAVLLCGIYPLVVWLFAQGLFPEKANGSLITGNGKPTGSLLIAQGFTGPGYFHPRPSAAGEGYDSTSSGGSNLGPLSRKLTDTVRQRVASYRAENNLSPRTMIPADAVTASASGLDPHISLKNAMLQAPRVARVRQLEDKTVLAHIMVLTEGRDLGFLGEPRINVLLLNMSLDGVTK